MNIEFKLNYVFSPLVNNTFANHLADEEQGQYVPQNERVSHNLQTILRDTPVRLVTDSFERPESAMTRLTHAVFGTWDMHSDMGTEGAALLSSVVPMIIQAAASTLKG